MVNYLNDFQLGMRDMFSDFANFSLMSERPIKVSEVKQKAFIEINEKGSEAAAVTGELPFYESYTRNIVKIFLKKISKCIVKKFQEWD